MLKWERGLTMDTLIIWRDIYRLAYPSDECTLEWAVEMYPIDRRTSIVLPDYSLPATIEVVRANNVRQAAKVALLTRNIPSNWVVTKVDR